MAQNKSYFIQPSTGLNLSSVTVFGLMSKSPSADVVSFGEARDYETWHVLPGADTCFD